MKKKPIYLLQMGGVLPVQAPIGPSENSAPLIQTASMPIDSGANILLGLRQQRMQERLFNKELAFKEKMAGKDDERWKAQLALQKEQFAWQKESYLKDFEQRASQWDTEFNLRRKMADIDLFFKKYDMYSSMLPSMTGPTGGNSRTKDAYGLSSGWHSAYQANRVSQARQAAMDSVMDLATSGGIDEFQDVEDRDKLMNMSPEMMEYANIISMASRQQMIHEQQIAEFRKNPDKYDKNYFEYMLEKVHASNSFEDVYNLLLPSIHEASKEFFEKYEDVYGRGKVVDLGDGVRAIERENVDLTEDYVAWGKFAYSDALKKLYQMELEEGTTSKDIPFETYADEYLRRSANAAYIPKIEYEGHNWDGSKQGPSRVRRSGPYGSDQMTYEVLPIRQAKVEGVGGKSIRNTTLVSPNFLADAVMTQNPVSAAITEIYSDRQSRLAGTIGKYRIREGGEEQFNMLLEDFLGGTVTGDSLTINETGQVIPLSDLRNEEGFLTLEGRKIYEDYLKIEKLPINSNISYLPYPDFKENGMYSAGSLGKELDENTYNAFVSGSRKIKDLQTGEIFTEQQFRRKYGDHWDEIEKSWTAHGIADYKNLLAIMGNTWISDDPGRFGVFPHIITVTTDDGKKKHDFALTRSEQFINEDNLMYKGGTMIYATAMAGRGYRATVPEQAFYDTFKNTGVPLETQKQLYGKIKNVRDSKGAGDSSVSMQWDDKSGGTGTIFLRDPHLAGKAAVLMNNIMEEASPDDHFELYQITQDGQAKFYVNANGRRSQLVPIEQEGISEILEEEASRGSAGLEDARRWFINAEFSDDPNLLTEMNKGFVQWWADEVDHRFGEIKYPISSGNRPGDNSDAGKGLSMDIGGRNPEVVNWFMTNVPGLEKTDVGVKYYSIPDSHFAVAWHRNMTVDRDENGHVIPGTKKVIPLNEPGGGYHFDIKLKSRVDLTPVIPANWEIVE